MALSVYNQWGLKSEKKKCKRFFEEKRPEIKWKLSQKEKVKRSMQRHLVVCNQMKPIENGAFHTWSHFKQLLLFMKIQPTHNRPNCILKLREKKKRVRLKAFKCEKFFVWYMNEMCLCVCRPKWIWNKTNYWVVGLVFRWCKSSSVFYGTEKVALTTNIQLVSFGKCAHSMW